MKGSIAAPAMGRGRASVGKRSRLGALREGRFDRGVDG
jgi:hypothetical protein